MLLPVEVPSDTEATHSSSKNKKKRPHVRKYSLLAFIDLFSNYFVLLFSESMTVGPHPKPGSNGMEGDEEDEVPKPYKASRVSSRHVSGRSVSTFFLTVSDLLISFFSSHWPLTFLKMTPLALLERNLVWPFMVLPMIWYDCSSPFYIC